MIPLLDLKQEYLELKGEIDAAVGRVLASGQFILGPEGQAFETELAAYVGVPHAIGLNSGTDALVIALRALDIGPGDEVLVPDTTFIATAEAVRLVGATPVFIDIEPVGFSLDPGQLPARATSRTKAVMVVHLYGLCADMDPILDFCRARGIHLIEDVAQALGASYKGRKAGSFGSLSCLSFFPTKNLGGYGDAGAILTSSPELDRRVRRLRSHGAEKRYHHEEIGYNSRLDELQAAILRVKLPQLDRWNARRRELAARYRAALDGTDIRCPAEPAGRAHIYHLFSVRSPRRDALRKHLESRRIACALHYPTPLHLQPALRGTHDAGADFPESRRLAAEVLSLPLYPQMTDAQQNEVAAAVREFCREAVGRV